MRFDERNLKLEVHIPCREPIDHLMSIANHIHKKFKCADINNNKKLEKSVKRSYVKLYSRRINNEFLKKVSTNSTKETNLQLKCFNYHSILDYIKHIGQFLRSRKIPVEEY